MNLLNRIKKLESRQIKSEGEFCDCYEIFYTKLLDKVYNQAPFDEATAALPEGDFCQKCQLRLSPQTLELNRNMQMIYGDFTA